MTPLVTEKLTTLLKVPRRMSDSATVYHLVQNYILNDCYSPFPTFLVPVDQIEQASRELRSYLAARCSIATSVLDHLDGNYIFGI